MAHDRRDASGRYQRPQGDRTPHPARGEVFSGHHEFGPDSRRGAPAWSRPLDPDDDDAQQQPTDPQDHPKAPLRIVR